MTQVLDCSKDFIIPGCKRKHSAIFPNTIRCVIAGSSGSGKTNLMIHLLRTEKLLNYSDVYIYSSTLYQSGYEYLKKYYGELEEIIKNKTKKTVKVAQFFDADDEIAKPEELDEDKNHIMVFDDVMYKDQTTIKDYFCRGRHTNVNSFYLCQSLYKIAKHGIRDNANMFILFKQGNKTLKYFHDNISGDMDYKEFKNYCDKAWSIKHGFVVINEWDDAECGRYWDNYTQIYTPEKFLQPVSDIKEK